MSRRPRQEQPPLFVVQVTTREWAKSRSRSVLIYHDTRRIRDYTDYAHDVRVEIIIEPELADELGASRKRRSAKRATS